MNKAEIQVKVKDMLWEVEIQSEDAPFDRDYQNVCVAKMDILERILQLFEEPQ